MVCIGGILSFHVTQSPTQDAFTENATLLHGESIVPNLGKIPRLYLERMNYTKPPLQLARAAILQNRPQNRQPENENAMRNNLADLYGISTVAVTGHGLQMTSAARLRRAALVICNRFGGCVTARCAFSRQCAATRRVADGIFPSMSCGQPGRPLHITA